MGHRTSSVTSRARRHAVVSGPSHRRHRPWRRERDRGVPAGGARPRPGAGRRPRARRRRPGARPRPRAGRLRRRVDDAPPGARRHLAGRDGRHQLGGGQRGGGGDPARGGQRRRCRRRHRLRAGGHLADRGQPRRRRLRGDPDRRRPPRGARLPRAGPAGRDPRHVRAARRHDERREHRRLEGERRPGLGRRAARDPCPLRQAPARRGARAGDPPRARGRGGGHGVVREHPRFARADREVRRPQRLPARRRPAADRHAARAARARPHPRGDRGAGRGGVLPRLDRRQHRRRDGAQRRADHEGRSRALPRRLARPARLALPRLDRRRHAPVLERWGDDGRDDEHPRERAGAPAVREHDARAPARERIAAIVHRPQHQAHPPSGRRAPKG